MYASAGRRSSKAKLVMFSRALALLCFTAMLAPTANAQDVPSVIVRLNTLPGDATVSKPIKTLRDLKFRDVVHQGYDYSCGSAALATVLRYGYGKQVNETQMIQDMVSHAANPAEVTRSGFSMLDMKRYSERNGMRAHGFKVDVEALYRLQIPVITLLDTRGYKHFVVVKGANAGRIMVADPALGHRVIYQDEFLKNWNGVVLAVMTDRDFNANSFLMQDKHSNALLRRNDALSWSSAPVPLVELGLIRADLM